MASGDATHKPLFNLYFWRVQNRPRDLLRCDQVKVFIEPYSTIPPSISSTDLPVIPTLCGSAVSITPGGPKRSTTGCVIQIGSEVYGLTASHAVRHLKRYSPPPSADKSDTDTDAVTCYTNSMHPRDLQYDSPTAMDLAETISDFNTLPPNYTDAETISEDVGFIIDELVYDEFTDESDDEDSTSEDKSHNADDQADGFLLMSPEKGGTETFAIFPAETNRNTSEDLDLDWALLSLKGIDSRSPNVFVDSQAPPHPVYFSEVATDHPDTETRVFIITDRHVVKSGMLQPIRSFLGGINGNRASLVWSVIMSDQQGKNVDSIGNHY
ncbi:hypothetical protein F4808DRAFT_171509 [Astrocystis sublimbata]|nr:hypothetical protein F4808DRAFT_171509 [Astrocystis sublimbata]